MVSPERLAGSSALCRTESSVVRDEQKTRQLPVQPGFQNNLHLSSSLTPNKGLFI